MCGIMGVISKYNRPDLGVLIAQGLYQQQNRGDFSTGMGVIRKLNVSRREYRFARRVAVGHGREIFEPLKVLKGEGRVNQVFTPQTLEEMIGFMGIGMVRYPTAGYAIPEEHSNLSTEELDKVRFSSLQPLTIQPHISMAMVHNGDINNFNHLMKEFKTKGLRQSTQNDLEGMLMVFAEEFIRISDDVDRAERIKESMINTMQRVDGTYSSLAMINNVGLIAFRDFEGRRPLVYGVLKDKDKDNKIIAYGFSSETVALDKSGFKGTLDLKYSNGKTQYDEVKPGEVIFISKDFEFYRFQARDASPKPCPFEAVYFQRAPSFFMGKRVKRIREEVIKQMWKEFEGSKQYRRLMTDQDNIIITSIPRTADTAGIELSNITGFRYTQAVEKHPNSARIFQQVNQTLREKGTLQNHYIYPEEVRGKKVIVIDDSIIRGTTMRNDITYLRDVGAKEIHVFVTFEPVRNPCNHAIDFHTAEELIGHKRSINQIKSEIGLRLNETLQYATIDQIQTATNYQGTFCNECFRR